MTSDRFLAISAALILLAAGQSPALACPLCLSGSDQTYSELLDKSDCVLLARWVRRVPASRHIGETTQFEIVEVGRDLRKDFATGNRLAIPGDQTKHKGELRLLVRSTSQDAESWTVQPITRPAWAYLRSAPGDTSPASERLRYCLPFLEHDDALIAADAHLEFSYADYRDLAALGPQLPREKLRHWSTAAPENRRRLYVRLLGICGTSDDAARLRGGVLRNSSDVRLHLDTEMATYLLLTGAAGLRELADSKLKDSNASFSDRFSLLEAVTFLQSNAADRFPREPLAEVVRRMLSFEDMADLALERLARLKDWSAIDRAAEFFAAPQNSTRRAAVRYLHACLKAGASDSEKAAATRQLASFRTANPRLVADVEAILAERAGNP